MKTNSLTLALAMLALAMPAQRTMAQNEILELPILVQNPIVRTLAPDSCVVVTSLPSPAIVKTALYNSSTAKYTFFPTLNGMTDMYILDVEKMAILCGNNSGTPRFDFVNLNTLDTISFTDPFLPVGGYAITSLNRLCAFRAPSGDYHVVAVGKSNDFGCIVDMIFHLPLTMGFPYKIAVYNLGKVDWQYHDVDVTDHFVVVAGSVKHDISPQTIFFFNKPIAPNMDIFTATPVVPQGGTTDTSGLQCVVAHGGGDTVATVYSEHARLRPNQLLVTFFVGPNSLASFHISPKAGTLVGDVRDAAFIGGKLYILHDLAISGSVTSAILQIDPSGTADCEILDAAFERHAYSLDTYRKSGGIGPLTASLRPSSGILTLHTFRFRTLGPCNINIGAITTPAGPTTFTNRELRPDTEVIKIDKLTNPSSPISPSTVCP